MAGDWIKMRTDLEDDPAVIGIAAAVERSEPEVVGLLHRLWCWANRHTTDGKAAGITARWVDKYVGLSGFANAMASQSWLIIAADSISFPDFGKHNGESAKSRAQNSLRQRASRERRASVAPRSLIPKPFVRVVTERDAAECVYCGSEFDISIDHLKPESRGGRSSVDNLACACRRCNMEKSDRTPEEWGVLPTFLQPGVEYVNGAIMSRDTRDGGVTEVLPEKRREEKRSKPPYPPQSGGGDGMDSQIVKQPPADPPGFSAWWAAYPSRRKAARRQCREVWVRQALEASAPAIMAGLERWRRSADWAKDGGQYIPAPVVWLRQARWEAEPDPATGLKAVPTAAATEAAERGREVLRGMDREQRRESVERFRAEVLRGMQVTYCIEDTTKFLGWLAGSALVNGGKET